MEHLQKHRILGVMSRGSGIRLLYEDSNTKSPFRFQTKSSTGTRTTAMRAEDLAELGRFFTDIAHSPQVETAQDREVARIRATPSSQWSLAESYFMEKFGACATC